MGAESFIAIIPASTAEDFPEAFNTAVDDAYYWFGHGGYTGEICEKSGYILFDIEPAPSEYQASFIADALCMSWGGDIEDLVVERFGDNAKRAVDIYNDKWGPALAFRLDDESFFFCGIASS